MNEKLIKFIELCLIDGKLTDKERNVIFNKAEELGVSKDECEVILDAMLFQKGITNSTSPSNLNIQDEHEEIIELQKPIINSAHFKSMLEGREYTLKIEISSDSQSRFIDINISALDLFEVYNYLPDISLLLKDFYIPNFSSWDNILNNLTPVDEGLNEILKYYGKGSYWRQTKSFSNGDVYEGVLISGCPNGIGVLRMQETNAIKLYGLGLNGSRFVVFKGEFKNSVFIRGLVTIEWGDGYEEVFENIESYKSNDEIVLKGLPDNIIKGQKTLLDLEKKIKYDLNWVFEDDSKEWSEVIYLIEGVMKYDVDILKSSSIAEKYIMALIHTDIEKAMNIYEVIFKNVDNKPQLFGIIGELLFCFGKDKNDINILNKSIDYFTKKMDSDKINDVKKVIKKIEDDADMGNHDLVGVKINNLYLSGKKAVLKRNDDGKSYYRRDNATELQIMIKDITAISIINYDGDKCIMITGRRRDESILSSQFSEATIFKDDESKKLLDLIEKARKNVLK